MKIKLFNGEFQSINLKVIAGGFDPTAAKVSLMVSGDAAQAGHIELDVTEARDLARTLLSGLPEVKHMGSVADASISDIVGIPPGRISTSKNHTTDKERA